MKVNIKASLGFAAQNEDSIEVPDDMTDDEIQEEVYEYIVSNMLGFGWEKEL